MKCPKCGYLGLDTGARCRHCGYEFSLSDPTPQPDRAADADQFVRPGTSHRRAPASPRPRHDRETPAPGLGVGRPLLRVPDSGPLDLPLFADDPSGMPAVPPPRPPLGVRRPTPTPARLRRSAPHREAEALDLGLEMPPVTPDPAADPPAPARAAGAGAEREVRPARPAAASPVRRLVAAGVDLALIGAIDATVLYFTLRVTELDLSRIAALPPVPFAAFFVILNGGYLVLFTGVFGQTLGKMLAGIEVVSNDWAPVDLGRACYRVVVSLLSVLTAGLGYLPAFFGEGRSLHDRIARTRVVQVPPS